MIEKKRANFIKMVEKQIQSLYHRDTVLPQHRWWKKLAYQRYATDLRYGNRSITEFYSILWGVPADLKVFRSRKKLHQFYNSVIEKTERGDLDSMLLTLSSGIHNMFSRYQRRKFQKKFPDLDMIVMTSCNPLDPLDPMVER